MIGISKSGSVVFIVATLLLNYINGHIIYLFPTNSLLVLTLFLLISSFLTYCYTFSNLSPSLLPFHLPTTIYLNTILLYHFIFLYFWIFLFPFLYYKFTILSLFYAHFFHTQNVISLSLSLSLSQFCFTSFLGIFFPVFVL